MKMFVFIKKVFYIGSLFLSSNFIILSLILCDKSCDFGEHLDYENCRKRLVDKLIEECNENIEETSLIKINSTKCKHNSCILYIVLFSILFTINIGIATYFVYYKYVNHNKENVSVYDYVYQRKHY